MKTLNELKRNSLKDFKMWLRGYHAGTHNNPTSTQLQDIISYLVGYHMPLPNSDMKVLLTLAISDTSLYYDIPDVEKYSYDEHDILERISRNVAATIEKHLWNEYQKTVETNV